MSRFNFIAPVPSTIHQPPSTPTPAAAVASVPPATLNSQPSTRNATISLNPEKNGVEIKFPGKPDADTLSKLKAAGWRWSFRGLCWYHKHTPENLAWAEALLGTSAVESSKLQVECSPTAAPTNIIPLPSAILHPPSSPPPLPAWRARLLRRPLSVGS